MGLSRGCSMKKIPIVLAAVLLAAIVPGSMGADGADKVINRYKKAAGTPSRRIENTLMVGTARIGDGAPGRFYYRAAGPDRIRVDIEAGDLKVSECYNGKSAWRQDARGLRTLLGTGASIIRLRAILANGRLRDLSRARIIARPATTGPPDGIKADGVEFRGNGVHAIIFFDQISGLPAVQEIEKSDGTQTYFFGDYRKVDG